MLSGYRVLDLTDHRGQLCGQILGDLGADVLLVEPPGGTDSRRMGPFAGDVPDPDRSLRFWGMNRNKRSIVADLDSADGRARVRDLAARSDFLLESFAPGYLEERGMGWDDLSRLNPRLVMVSLSAFGSDGPKAGWAASDLTVLASSGVLQLTGDDDRPPTRVAVPQGYLHGAAEGAAAALAAHLARERDGVGQHLDVSAQSAAMLATQHFVLAAAWGESEVQRLAGGLKIGPIVLRLINPAKDGFVSVTFLFGTAIGPFTRRLMEVMWERGFVDEATRDKDWLTYTTLLMSGQEPLSELYRCIDAIARFTGAHTRDELYRLARERDLLIVPVVRIPDLLASPQLASRGYWTPVAHPELGRDVIYPGALAKLSATPLAPPGRPPLLGEHDAEPVGSLQARHQELPAAAAPSGTTRRPPLEGLKVVDLMWVMAGPETSRMLADLGATVIKVESTRMVDTARTLQPFKDGVPGPERSGLFATVAAGKLGLTLNLRSESGRRVFDRLVGWADVVTESFAAGALERMGLTYERLRSINPSLVMLSSCLNGQTGPEASLAGFGTMGAQLAGFGDLAGWPDRPPAGPFGAYTDYISPKLAVAVLLAALDHRRRTGEGQYIDFSQSEASIHFLTPAILDYSVNGRVWSREGNASREYAPHGVYPLAGEDRWVAVVAETDAQWRALAGAIGRPDWLADARFATAEGRRRHSGPLDDGIAEWTSTRDAEEVERVLQAVGVPAHRASRSAELLADPQLTHRGHWVTVPHAELGPVVIEGPRVGYGGTAVGVARPGPTFGQDNDYVLREILGLSDDEIVELIADGALE